MPPIIWRLDSICKFCPREERDVRVFGLVACCRPLEMDVSLLALPASNAKERAGKCACVKIGTRMCVEVVVDVKKGQF